MGIASSRIFNGERMIYRPAGPLGALIEGMRIGDPPQQSDPPSLRRIVPDRSPHLIYYRFDAPGYLAGRRVPAGASDLLLVGPRRIYRDIDPRGRTITAIASFRPGAVAGLLHVPLEDLADVAVPARDVLCVATTGLVDRLDRATGAAGVLRILRDELTRLSHLHEPDPLVNKMLRRIEQAPSRFRLRRFADEVGIGERRLRARFATQVGLSPKRVARLSRLTGVLTTMSDPCRNWSTVAHDAGYADHSHMVREFNALLGETPVRFAARITRPEGSGCRFVQDGRPRLG